MKKVDPLLLGNNPERKNLRARETHRPALSSNPSPLSFLLPLPLSSHFPPLPFPPFPLSPLPSPFSPLSLSHPLPLSHPLFPSLLFFFLSPPFFPLSLPCSPPLPLFPRTTPLPPPPPPPHNCPLSPLCPLPSPSLPLCPPPPLSGSMSDWVSVLVRVWMSVTICVPVGVHVSVCPCVCSSVPVFLGGRTPEDELSKVWTQCSRCVLVMVIWRTVERDLPQVLTRCVLVRVSILATNSNDCLWLDSAGVDPWSLRTEIITARFEWMEPSHFSWMLLPLTQTMVSGWTSLA